MNRWMDECLTAAEETNEYSGSEHIVSACRLGGVDRDVHMWSCGKSGSEINNVSKQELNHPN